MKPLEEFARQGDYLVHRDTLEKAEETFEGRSPRSQAVDRAMRGTITTDFERWERLHGRGVDFPGVDTPSSSPRQAIADHLAPRERARMASGRPDVGRDVMLAEDSKRPNEGHDSVIDSIGGITDDMWDVSGRLANVFRPGTVPRQ